jgi:deoxyadenosine/deoxycytidine kinase
MLQAHSILQGCVVEIEGCISSGKSTLTSRLVDLLNEKETKLEETKTEIKTETKETKTKVEIHAIAQEEKINHEFLAEFYSNPKKWGFAFQGYILASRLFQLREAQRLAKNEHNTVILDRGAVGDSVFATLAHKMGNLSDDELRIYKSICRDSLPRTISSAVDIILYLDVSPKECYRRMSTLRKRSAEDGVPLTYLESLDTMYFDLLCQWLGNRREVLDDMNIGTIPTTIIIPWEVYGDANVVLTALMEAKEGKRKSPIVSFHSRDEWNSVKDIQKHNKRALIMDREEDIMLICSSTQLTPILPFSVLYVNWNLKHSEEYKRIVMKYLATAHTSVWFYDGEVIVAV